MGVVVVDSSVLIAVLDDGHLFHDQAQRELTRAAATGDVVIPAVAFSEVLVVPYRLGKEQGHAVELQLRAVGAIAPVDPAIASAAAQLRAALQVRLPDALIIATASAFGDCQILTFDKKWVSIDPRVRVLGASG